MQTCPFCGHDFKIELSRVQGPWAFYECSKCMELSIVRGHGEFDLPARAPASRPPQVAEPELTRSPGEPPPFSPALRALASQSQASTPPVATPVTLARPQPQLEPAIAPLASRLPGLPKIKAPQLPELKLPVSKFARLRIPAFKRIPLPGSALLRSWAISSSSFAMTLICGTLVVIAILLPFTLPLLRDAFNAYQGIQSRGPASANNSSTEPTQPTMKDNL